MRIAWFTPFNKRSAIGRFSSSVVPELAKLAQVDLCHFDHDETWALGGTVKRYPSAAAVSPADLSAYDAVIYNFGNHLPFHRDIFILSRRHPGICIMHDFIMHHFFAAYYLEEMKDEAAYEALMNRHYGEAGAAAALDSLLPGSTRMWETDEVGKFPLFEEVLPGALGVIAHSEFFAERLRSAFPGPVTRIPLAYDVKQGMRGASRRELGVDESSVLIVSIGHVNPNKRVKSVIEALGMISPDVKPFEYVVLGPCSEGYLRELQAVARQSNLGQRVRLVGEVSDDVLRAYLTSADICVNLRYPAIEGASASVIEEMLYGKPVVVTDIGFFHELPNECVLKVEPFAHKDLVEALKRLIADERARKNIGSAAKRFAEQQFRADRYAREVVEFVWDVQSSKPLLSLADRIAGESARMGLAAGNPVVQTIASEIYNTFCKKPGADKTHGRGG